MPLPLAIGVKSQTHSQMLEANDKNIAHLCFDIGKSVYRPQNVSILNNTLC